MLYDPVSDLRRFVASADGSDKKSPITPRQDMLIKCDSRAQSPFAELCECLPTGRDHADFERYIKPVRNTVAFHYDPKQVNSALEFRTTHPSNLACSMTVGEDIHSCRFEFADVVLDTIVYRKLWQIPVDADVRVEADLQTGALESPCNFSNSQEILSPSS
jgi:hypothetical protein